MCFCFIVLSFYSDFSMALRRSKRDSPATDSLQIDAYQPDPKTNALYLRNTFEPVTCTYNHSHITFCYPSYFLITSYMCENVPVYLKYSHQLIASLMNLYFFLDGQDRGYIMAF